MYCRPANDEIAPSIWIGFSEARVRHSIVRTRGQSLLSAPCLPLCDWSEFSVLNTAQWKQQTCYVHRSPCYMHRQSVIQLTCIDWQQIEWMVILLHIISKVTSLFTNAILPYIIQTAIHTMLMTLAWICTLEKALLTWINNHADASWLQSLNICPATNHCEFSFIWLEPSLPQHLKLVNVNLNVLPV